MSADVSVTELQTLGPREKEQCYWLSNTRTDMSAVASQDGKSRHNSCAVHSQLFYAFIVIFHTKFMIYPVSKLI
jgi:hypothetical protein